MDLHNYSCIDGSALFEKQSVPTVDYASQTLYPEKCMV